MVNKQRTAEKLKHFNKIIQKFWWKDWKRLQDL